MKLYLPAFVGIVVLFGGSCAPSSEPRGDAAPAATAAVPANETENTIVQLERDWVAAIVNKDTAALDRLLATDFAGTSPTAHTFTKFEALDDLKGGKYVVEKMALDDVSVTVYGNTAVSFTSQEEKSSYEGQNTSGHYHFTDVWVKNGGQWQVVASHGTRYDRAAEDERTAEIED